MEEGILQEIIFSQCFNYVNWTGSIKVPGILQYARKAANFHVDVLNDKEAPESLLSRLYYI
jgi:aubergine